MEDDERLNKLIRKGADLLGRHNEECLDVQLGQNLIAIAAVARLYLELAIEV